MKNLTALISGLVFGLGIAISGMANPAKVLNFFDLAGTWDPSLAFVMGGALTWAIGQVMVRALGQVGGFTLIAWVAAMAAPQPLWGSVAAPMRVG